MGGPLSHALSLPTSKLNSQVRRPARTDRMRRHRETADDGCGGSGPGQVPLRDAELVAFGILHHDGVAEGVILLAQPRGSRLG